MLRIFSLELVSLYIKAEVFLVIAINWNLTIRQLIIFNSETRDEILYYLYLVDQTNILTHVL